MMHLLFRRMLLLAVFLCPVVATAAPDTQPATSRAAEGLALGAAAPQTQPQPLDFRKGDYELTLMGGYNREFAGTPEMGYGALGAGYFLFDDFSINLEARYYRSSQEGPDANIYALDFQIRQHIVHKGDFSLFLDVSVAVSEADHRVPMGGTNFNFIEEFGVGATYRLCDNCYFIGGVRYFHLSNAHLHGADENPSLNGIGYYVGLMWTFK
jgi:hypothetical protein